MNRVAWSCNPLKGRPSKRGSPWSCFSSLYACSIRQRIFASRKGALRCGLAEELLIQ